MSLTEGFLQEVMTAEQTQLIAQCQLWQAIVDFLLNHGDVLGEIIAN